MLLLDPTLPQFVCCTVHDSVEWQAGPALLPPLFGPAADPLLEYDRAAPAGK
jgi:hypothetical protein